MSRDHRRSNDPASRRVVELVGWWMVILGVAGLIFHREYLPIWVALIAFGLAELPLQWFRKSKRGKAP